MTLMQRRHLFSTALAVTLVLLLLVLASLDGLVTPEPPPLIALREVRVFVPPPPPPPPPLTQRAASGMAGSPVALAAVPATIDLEIMELAVELPAGQPGSFGSGLGDTGEGSGTDWGTVSLSTLDSIPMVINAPLIAYPAQLSAQNINQFEVMFHIIIDETGRTYPVQLVRNPYPGMNEELLAYAAQVRFSPPEKLGVPVRTEYLWPVAFKRD